MKRRAALAVALPGTVLMAGLMLFAWGANCAVAQTTRDVGRPTPVCEPASLDSPYIPVDSWIYPAVMRLYGLGFIDTVYLGMRPWTRANIQHMLEEAGGRLEDAQDYDDPATDEAQSIYQSLTRELNQDMQGPCNAFKGKTRVESVYTVARAITGNALRDDFHLGSSIVNDYGRPFASGFNSYTGASGYASAGRFQIYARGEFQGSPSDTGYSVALAQTLSGNDLSPFINPATGLPFNQATIPMGTINSAHNFRLLEAYASTNVLRHEISFGKQDSWLGPATGGGMAYSNNAENIYTFRINRIEPLHVPGLSYFTGPFRYDFMVGSLKGHTAPNDPWIHIEQVSFRPTENLEFGFERSAIWGGKGHVPITIKSFLRSFFSFSGVVASEKFSRRDPGARFGSFNFSYRLPYMRNWLTLYSDSEVHDDVSPIDAPRRSSWRPGLYLSHVPGVPKLDVRGEAVWTDPPVESSFGGRFMYWEVVQVQGYTNKGHLLGDWIGREGKGAQGWVTYHISGNEWFQVGFRNQKVAKDFIPGSTTQRDPITGNLIDGGTTLNDINFQVVKRLSKDFELNGKFDYQHWKAPIYLPGQQTLTNTTIQLTWFPERKVSF